MYIGCVSVGTDGWTVTSVADTGVSLTSPAPGPGMRPGSGSDNHVSASRSELEPPELTNTESLRWLNVG